MVEFSDGGGIRPLCTRYISHYVHGLEHPRVYLNNLLVLIETSTTKSVCRQKLKGMSQNGRNVKYCYM